MITTSVLDFQYQRRGIKMDKRNCTCKMKFSGDDKDCKYCHRDVCCTVVVSDGEFKTCQLCNTQTDCFEIQDPIFPQQVLKLCHFCAVIISQYGKLRSRLCSGIG